MGGGTTGPRQILKPIRCLLCEPLASAFGKPPKWNGEQTVAKYLPWLKVTKMQRVHGENLHGWLHGKTVFFITTTSSHEFR